jgi:thiamine-monophosphate kinase
MTEATLIAKLTGGITLRNPSTIKGVGDDAAILAHEGKTLLATNILLEQIHFDLAYTPLKHLGYKAAVVNFSDIYAMNAYPKQLMVALGVSGKFSEAQIEELYSGIALACEDYGVDIAGGDLTTSLTGLTIACTAAGERSEDKIVYRSGAKVSDLVCVTGNFGAAYMGLLVLEREKKVFEAGGKDLQLDSHEYIIGRCLKPQAQRHLIEALDAINLRPTAMIDVSKGLSADVQALCQQSGVGVRLYLEKIPIAQETNTAAAELNMNAAIAALHGGEDYEMLFTIPIAMHDKIKELGKIDVIGHIVEPQQGAILVTNAGSSVPLSSQCFNEQA